MGDIVSNPHSASNEYEKGEASFNLWICVSSWDQKSLTVQSCYLKGPGRLIYYLDQQPSRSCGTTKMQGKLNPS